MQLNLQIDDLNNRMAVTGIELAQLQTRIADLKIQAACCAQIPYPTVSLYANTDLMYRCSALSSPMPRIAQPYKKKLTLAELDRILFPFDPIRDWSDREVARIEAKYAWLDRYQ